MLKVKHARGSHAAVTLFNNNYLTQDPRPPFFGSEAWPIVKLPPCRDLQGETAEKLLPLTLPLKGTLLPRKKLQGR